MYLAIDIGGTKTLVATFDGDGRVDKQYKFPTDKSYPGFITDLKQILATEFTDYKFIACCCAVPGQIDHQKGLALHEGNLPWQDKAPIKKDLESILTPAAVFIENDAKLAGLGEALTHKNYRHVLYLTISTGIGAGIISDGQINPTLINSEPGQMVLEFDGKLDKWENFASGRALAAKYGKKASEINEAGIWQDFSRALARGMIELIAIIQPDVIILGGGVGAHFEKYAAPLNEELAKLANQMVKPPPIIKAKRPEEAVIYGCYELARQKV